MTGFYAEAVPWNETWAFDEPYSSRTGWLYDDGSSVTNFSSALSSMTFGGGSLGFSLVGAHGASCCRYQSSKTLATPFFHNTTQTPISVEGSRRRRICCERCRSLRRRRG